jgi:hypothetical protein
MVRDVVSEMVASSAQGLGVAPAAPAPPVSSHPEADISGRRRTAAVRIDSDSDLAAFVRHLLTLFENPKNRQDVRAGRHTFRLISHATAPKLLGAESTLSACRVERGAVTERQIKSIAESRQRLVLGRAAVLTPLARERARALGVPIEKEH